MRVLCRILVLLSLLAPIAPAIATADEPPRPNILFAIADDWSFGHAGIYGCVWTKTPTFDRIAREGLLFTRAYTPNAKCAPSRACIVTGRNSWQLKDACNHICYFPAEFKSYAEALAAHGYFVGTTGKGWGPGVALDADGRPRQMTGRPFQTRKTPPPARAISNNDYAANFGDFLEAAPADRPWCFWYGAFEPHRGYEYGAGIKKAGKQLNDIERVPGFWPDDDTVRTDMLDYAFEVEHFDRHLGRMLELLAERGELERTLVVMTSDHGMPFPRCKGQAYDYSNHVPLAIMWPERIQDPGRVLETYVSFVDFAPTFLDVAGASWEELGMAPTPGHSLVPLFDSQNAHPVFRDHILIGKERHDIGRPGDVGYPIRGIVQDNWLYIRNYETERWPAGDPITGYLNCDGSPTKSLILELHRNGSRPGYWDACFGRRPGEELYNLTADPDCMNNLAELVEQRTWKEKLRARMERELLEQKDPRMEGQGGYFDRIPYANAGTRNFYERYLRGEKLNAGWVNPSDFESQK